MHIHVCFNGGMDKEVEKEDETFMDVDAFIKNLQ